MLGMAKGTVAMWEMGKRNPSFEALEKMSEIFDKRLDYILGTSDNPASRRTCCTRCCCATTWRLLDSGNAMAINVRIWGRLF